MGEKRKPRKCGGRGAVAKNAAPSEQSEGGLESNPLTSSISLSSWVSCLPRWILRTRTGFSRCLASAFAVVRRSDAATTAIFPLPLACLKCFGSSGPGLSRKRFWSLCKARLVNVWILVLNFMYLGRWPSHEEL